jgi:hypothetical protein
LTIPTPNDAVSASPHASTSPSGHLGGFVGEVLEMAEQMVLATLKKERECPGSGESVFYAQRAIVIVQWRASLEVR